eukprot:TRINITY_DN2407_c0_g1_i10.p1 TRINITY_DN2407_c0_g1~~TRINITY_DN2407_c0_g1_i10.p1  ORF type:complete len:421 (+),score=38.87 TRINITY_DN2407_c0_g1_i10:105-1367(+)
MLSVSHTPYTPTVWHCSHCTLVCKSRGFGSSQVCCCRRNSSAVVQMSSRMAFSFAREATMFGAAQDDSQEQAGLRSRVNSSLRLLVKAAVPLGLGFAAGAACHSMSASSRLRVPEAPVSESEQLQAPIVDDGIYPPPFLIGDNRVCGAARCTPRDVCCPAAPGFGFACGRSDAVCCQGNRGSVVCGANGQCCRNRHGASYCCAPGNFCEADVCVAQQGTHCFPGHSMVDVQSRGPTAVRDLEVGDNVLVERSDSVRVYEPVLGYIHAVKDEEAAFMVIRHGEGELYASSNHMVFVTDGMGVRESKPAAGLDVGAMLVLAGDNASAAVLSVRREVGAKGMFAPLTASGTIVVNNATVSAYAAVEDIPLLNHAAVHAAHFFARAHSVFALGQLVAIMQPLLLVLFVKVFSAMRMSVIAAGSA